MSDTKIPEGWLNYSPVGEIVPETRFISFKVPLKQSLCVGRAHSSQWFTLEHLFDSVRNIGLVIDLTNTSRYYTKEDILRHGVEYVKISCPGRVIPSSKSIQIFFDAVDSYLHRHSRDDSLIGVHCTHGVNRSGYFVARYMIQKMDIPFAYALESVERARGHRMVRPVLINHLRTCSEARDAWSLSKNKKPRLDNPRRSQSLEKRTKDVRERGKGGREEFFRQDLVGKVYKDDMHLKELDDRKEKFVGGFDRGFHGEGYREKIQNDGDFRRGKRGSSVNARRDQMPKDFPGSGEEYARGVPPYGSGRGDFRREEPKGSFEGRGGRGLRSGWGEENRRRGERGRSKEKLEMELRGGEGNPFSYGQTRREERPVVFGGQERGNYMESQNITEERRGGRGREKETGRYGMKRGANSPVDKWADNRFSGFGGPPTNIHRRSPPPRSSDYGKRIMSSPTSGRGNRPIWNEPRNNQEYGMASSWGPPVIEPQGEMPERYGSRYLEPAPPPQSVWQRMSQSPPRRERRRSEEFYGPSSSAGFRKPLPVQDELPFMQRHRGGPSQRSLSPPFDRGAGGRRYKSPERGFVRPNVLPGASGNYPQMKRYEDHHERMRGGDSHHPAPPGVQDYSSPRRPFSVSPTPPKPPHIDTRGGMPLDSGMGPQDFFYREESSNSKRKPKKGNSSPEPGRKKNLFLKEGRKEGDGPHFEGKRETDRKGRGRRATPRRDKSPLTFGGKKEGKEWETGEGGGFGKKIGGEGKRRHRSLSPVRGMKSGGRFSPMGEKRARMGESLRRSPSPPFSQRRVPGNVGGGGGGGFRREEGGPPMNRDWMERGRGDFDDVMGGLPPGVPPEDLDCRLIINQKRLFRPGEVCPSPPPIQFPSSESFRRSPPYQKKTPLKPVSARLGSPPKYSKKIQERLGSRGGGPPPPSRRAPGPNTGGRRGGGGGGLRSFDGRRR